MLFTEFILNRMETLERATHGYGRRISERALFETLTEQGMPIDEFLVLMQWGVLSGLLCESEHADGRRYEVHRESMAAWRARANGETGTPMPGATVAKRRERNQQNTGHPPRPVQ